ncbi:MAG: ferric reductase-like transmembrane domain-containing protein [Microgenomates group bacterium]
MNLAQFILTKLLPLKQKFIYASILFNGLGMLLVAITAVVPEGRMYWRELGLLAGKLAILVLGVTLVPGIFKRFQVKGVLAAVQVLLMSVRRALGLMVYFLTVGHLLWVRILPRLYYNLSLSSFTNYEIIGLIALILLTPMALSSNDPSMRMLGKNWKKIHSAVYVIIWLIFLHVLLMEGSLKFTVLAGLFGVLEILSWIYYYKNRPKSTITTPVESTTSEVIQQN